ncbi:hypothetical protein TNIN_275831 [Trichonephila inaurata madagascariensis]|uniref:Uncharacterized protein n=1 Tax=Trichonephila inaurata madagascariensis TaxID=2747483 RepID=A0A8X6YED3_9ARAC|nr:hypothetical protein TNIN_275831 [Trichonephila inaurata madagascariensis]
MESGFYFESAGERVRDYKHWMTVPFKHLEICVPKETKRIKIRFYGYISEESYLGLDLNMIMNSNLYPQTSFNKTDSPREKASIPFILPCTTYYVLKTSIVYICIVICFECTQTSFQIDLISLQRPKGVSSLSGLSSWGLELLVFRLRPSRAKGAWETTVVRLVTQFFSVCSSPRTF